MADITNILPCFISVKRALLGKKLHIVHIDWFDFSCNRNRRLPEKDYNFKALRDEERVRKRLLMAEVKAKKNHAMGERWINPGEHPFNITSLSPYSTT